MNQFKHGEKINSDQVIWFVFASFFVICPLLLDLSVRENIAAAHPSSPIILRNGSYKFFGDHPIRFNWDDYHLLSSRRELVQLIS